MKNLKNKTKLTALSLLFFLTFNANAQPLIEVSPANSLSVAEAIVNKMGSRVQINVGEINQFLASHFNTSNLNPSIEPMRAYIQNANLPFIELAWSPISNVIDYNIHHIDLHTGQQAGFPTDKLKGIISTPNQNLHLVAFYSNTINGRSFLNVMLVESGAIVIVDKDIFKDDNIVEHCEDPVSLPVESENTHIYSASFDFPNPCPVSRYFVEVERKDDDGNLIIAEYLIHYTASGASQVPTINVYAFNDPIDNPPYFLGIQGKIEVVLTTEKFTVLFPNKGNATNSKINAYQCTCPKDLNVTPVKKEKPINVKIFPNPTQNKTTINYQLPESSDVTIYLVDALTQRKVRMLHSGHQVSGSHQLDFDMQAFRAGVYYCIIQTKYKQESIKLIKVD